MSKYTTEVRYICEQKAGLEESVGFANVDSVLNSAWDKIFTTRCTFFDESYRPILCKKILKHYYTREIGAETVGLWLLWLNTRLEEIMPYYNQLYRSELLQFNPMQNINLTRVKDIDGTETGNKETSKSYSTDTDISLSDSISENNTTSNSREGSGSSTYSNTENKTDNVSKSSGSRNAFSDTPQSAIKNVDDYRYLTDYRRITEEETEQGTHGLTGTGSSSYSDEIEASGSEYKSKSLSRSGNNETEGSESSETDTSITTTQDYVETLVGTNGNYTNSKLLQEFRDTFLNIDMLVIGEFKSLFMGLW